MYLHVFQLVVWIIQPNIIYKDIDNIIGEGDFNGSEIIDRLEALISSPVDLGNADKLTLISDFQTLIESLGAAAAGGQQAGANAGNTTSNGSTFNSIFSPINDNLSGIAETDKWVNLSESISSIPIDTGNDINVPTVSISDATINENEGFISFVITLSAPSDEVVTVVLRTQDGTAKEISDYIASFGTLVFLPGETTLTFDVPVVNDSIYEVSKNLFLNIEEIHEKHFGKIEEKYSFNKEKIQHIKDIKKLTGVYSLIQWFIIKTSNKVFNFSDRNNNLWISFL